VSSERRCWQGYYYALLFTTIWLEYEFWNRNFRRSSIIGFESALDQEVLEVIIIIIIITTIHHLSSSSVTDILSSVSSGQTLALIKMAGV
jgi:hypothetical protein